MSSPERDSNQKLLTLATVALSNLLDRISGTTSNEPPPPQTLKGTESPPPPKVIDRGKAQIDRPHCSNCKKGSRSQSKHKQYFRELNCGVGPSYVAETLDSSDVSRTIDFWKSSLSREISEKPAIKAPQSLDDDIGISFDLELRLLATDIAGTLDSSDVSRTMDFWKSSPSREISEKPAMKAPQSLDDIDISCDLELRLCNQYRDLNCVPESPHVVAKVLDSYQFGMVDVNASSSHSHGLLEQREMDESKLLDLNILACDLNLKPWNQSEGDSSSFQVQERLGTSKSPSISRNSKQILFQKKLYQSDVDRQDRLLVPKKHVDCFGVRDPMKTGQDETVTIADEDEGTEMQFLLGFWASSKSYVLKKAWSQYRKKKKLRKGDMVIISREEITNRLWIGVSRTLEMEEQPGTSSSHPYQEMEPCCSSESTVIEQADAVQLPVQNTAIRCSHSTDMEMDDADMEMDDEEI